MSELGMSYHDNDVDLLDESSDPTRIHSGKFTVNALSITSGQDPETYNRVGDTKSFDVSFDQVSKYGTITFTVGRQGSGTVADFFNENIKSSESTFNHGAGDLNFAFLGPLELLVKLGDQDPTTVTFNDMCLAQGSSFVSNNWWVGIKGSSQSGNSTIKINDSSGKWEGSFTRGGNQENAVGIVLRPLF